MAITWEDVAKATNGEMVGGHLYARIDGKLVKLGEKRGPQFDFTTEGAEIANELDSVKPKRRGKNLELNVADEASLDELLG